MQMWVTMCVYIYACVCVCQNMHINVSRYMYICVCMNAYIYIYIYIYIYLSITYFLYFIYVPSLFATTSFLSILLRSKFDATEKTYYWKYKSIKTILDTLWKMNLTLKRCKTITKTLDKKKEQNIFVIHQLNKVSSLKSSDENFLYNK